MAVYGFIRHSDDFCGLQQAAARLAAAGVDPQAVTVADDASALLASLRRGDLLVVTSLSEMCDSIQGVFDLLQRFGAAGAVLRSLDEPWLRMQGGVDWQDFGAGMSAFGKRMRSERTRMGLQRAQACGTKLGRPSGVSPKKASKVNNSLTLYTNSRMSVREICNLTGCNPRTFYRYLKENGSISMRRG